VKDHQKKVNQDDPPSGLEEAGKSRSHLVLMQVIHLKREVVESRNPDDPPLGLEEAGKSRPVPIPFIFNVK